MIDSDSDLISLDSAESLFSCETDDNREKTIREHVMIKVLEDEATIGDQQIDSDSVIYMLFIDDSGGCEDIDIPVYTADHGEEKEN